MMVRAQRLCEAGEKTMILPRFFRHQDALNRLSVDRNRILLDRGTAFHRHDGEQPRRMASRTVYLTP